MIRFRTILTAAALLGTPAAAAQSAADLAARQELVAQADAARDTGDHARALDLATRASRIRMTPSLQLFIAQEQRAAGQLVDAYANALACARAARADATIRNREAILGTCESTARALDPLLGRVRVALPVDAPADVQLQVADAEVPAALREQPRVVMPGAVRVRATAPGRAPFEQEVRVAAGATVDVRVVWSVVVVAANTPTRRGPNIAPWIVAGVGVAGVAAAGVLFGLAAAAQSDRDALCTARGCLPPAQEHDARYRDDALYGNVALGVGAALVVGGVVWYLVARPRASSVAWSAPFVIRF